MTRDEAVQICINKGHRVLDTLRDERPQRLCDRLEWEAAEDMVDVLVALGVLKIDDASSHLSHELQAISPDAAAPSQRRPE